MTNVLNTTIANQAPAYVGCTGLRTNAQHATVTNAQPAKRLRADRAIALAVRPEH